MQSAGGVGTVDMLNEVSGAIDWEIVSDDEPEEPPNLGDSEDECDCPEVPTHLLSLGQQQLRKHRESQKRQVAEMAEFARLKESEEVAKRIKRSIVEVPSSPIPFLVSKRQRKRLAQMQEQWAEAQETAALRGRDIEVWIKELEDEVSECNEDPCESQSALINRQL